MEFFNKKEEVLDFKLTEYGKYLLAIGRLSPSYYAFFDDDILYDVSGSGMVETPSQAEGRIQSETPSIKVIPTRTSAEERVNSFVQQVTELLGPNSDPADKVDIFSQVEAFEDKGKINSHPIGRSSLDSRYYPAWAIELLSHAQISSSVAYLNDQGRIENTPQVNIDIDYKMFFSAPGSPQSSTGTGGVEIQNIGLNDSSLFLSVENNYLMLEIMEKNTDFEKENFEIEIFNSGSYTPDSATQFMAPLPIENDLNIPGNIEYYFNVMVDEEIPDNIYDRALVNPKAVSTNAQRLKLNRDIYTTEPEEPC